MSADNTRGNHQDIIWERAEGLELISLLDLGETKSIDKGSQVFHRHLKKKTTGEEIGQ